MKEQPPSEKCSQIREPWLSAITRSIGLESRSNGKMMKTFLGLVLGLALGSAMHVAAAESVSFGEVKREAESYFKEGSYAKARESYQRLATQKLSGEEKRWLEFRLADTEWRAQ